MLHIEQLDGYIADEQFDSLRCDYIDVPWFDAGKRRQLLRSELGEELEINLKVGSFLRAGAVLAADRQRAIVVRRALARAVRVSFAADADDCLLLREVAVLAHSFGNQHTPIQFYGGDLVAPILTSDAVVAESINNLNLTAVELAFLDFRLFEHAPPGNRIASEGSTA